MEIGGRYVPRSTLALGLILLLVVGGGLAYFLSRGSNGAPQGGPTLQLPTAATEAPTIATGHGAQSQVTGHKLLVTIQRAPEIQSGQWAVRVRVQGGKLRNKILASKPLKPGSPFVISNDADGAYSVTPEILNCAKGCGASDHGYTLPPLTINPHQNATVIIEAKCSKSPLPAGIDCSRSQVAASYK